MWVLGGYWWRVFKIGCGVLWGLFVCVRVGGGPFAAATFPPFLGLFSGSEAFSGFLDGGCGGCRRHGFVPSGWE